MSVHFWGENPIGEWTLKFKSYQGLSAGKITKSLQDLFEGKITKSQQDLFEGNINKQYQYVNNSLN